MSAQPAFYETVRQKAARRWVYNLAFHIGTCCFNAS